ncbi:hypothetical protein MRX96_009829 [Rhipicephalus microplus]
MLAGGYEGGRAGVPLALPAPAVLYRSPLAAARLPPTAVAHRRKVERLPLSDNGFGSTLGDQRTAHAVLRLQAADQPSGHAACSIAAASLGCPTARSANHCGLRHCPDPVDAKVSSDPTC